MARSAQEVEGRVTGGPRAFEYGREIEGGTWKRGASGREGEGWSVIDAQHQLVKPPCVELL